jgi:hypothetical protein
LVWSCKNDVHFETWRTRYSRADRASGIPSGSTTARNHIITRGGFDTANTNLKSSKVKPSILRTLSYTKIKQEADPDNLPTSEES